MGTSARAQGKEEGGDAPCPFVYEALREFVIFGEKEDPFSLSGSAPVARGVVEGRGRAPEKRWKWHDAGVGTSADPAEGKAKEDRGANMKEGEDEFLMGFIGLVADDAPAPGEKEGDDDEAGGALKLDQERPGGLAEHVDKASDGDSPEGESEALSNVKKKKGFSEGEERVRGKARKKRGWQSSDGKGDAPVDSSGRVGSGSSSARADLPPWMQWHVAGAAAAAAEGGSCDGGGFRSPLLQLHKEIVDFCQFVAPTEEEQARRREAVQRVSDVVKSIWPQCDVKVFGSYATGLYLPSSDIDAVVLNSGCHTIKLGLKALARALVNRSVARNMQVIAHARVPIVKFVDSQSAINFDISFDVANGPDAAVFITKAMEKMAPLRPLSMVLKLFLQQRGLNEVYSGGIGSYALLVMLIAHLQLHPSRWHGMGKLEGNLGLLLVDFFALYGQHLNANDVGVSIRHGGRFFSKRRFGMVDAAKPYLLCVEDPQTTTNDLARSSFNIRNVRAAFKRAYLVLTDPLNVPTTQPATPAAPHDAADELHRPSATSLLSRILRADDKALAGRQPPPSPPLPLAPQPSRHRAATLTGNGIAVSVKASPSALPKHDSGFPRGGHMKWDDDSVPPLVVQQMQHEHQLAVQAGDDMAQREWPDQWWVGGEREEPHGRKRKRSRDDEGKNDAHHHHAHHGHHKSAKKRHNRSQEREEGGSSRRKHASRTDGGSNGRKTRKSDQSGEENSGAQLWAKRQHKHKHKHRSKGKEGGGRRDDVNGASRSRSPKSSRKGWRRQADGGGGRGWSHE